jgi:hypothetical protein
MHGRPGTVSAMAVGAAVEPGQGELHSVLARLFAGNVEGFVTWMGERTKPLLQTHDQAMRDADLETVVQFIESKAHHPLPPAPPEQTTADPRNVLDLMLPFLDEHGSLP